MRFRVMLGCALVLVVLLAGCAGPITRQTVTPAPTSADGAHFDKAACQFTLDAGFVEGKNVRCGYLSVRENHSDAASKMIRLAVAVFTTPSPHPAPDPVMFLQGGPGGRLIEDFAPLVISHKLDLATQFGNHDLIMLDQRGTGYSLPSLQCPEMVALQYHTDQNLTPQQQVEQQNTALGTCHTRLVGQGINLSAYTTLNDAADVHDLIAALGYKQVDLYGVSYGTRLALEVMRAFPEGIRSVVLDSTVPAQSRLLTSIPSDTARVFGVFFQGCAVDSACNGKYPGLENAFYSLVTALNARPVTFDTTDFNTGKHYTVLFHGDDLVNLLFQAFYATELIPYLPAMIGEASQGTYSHLVSLLYGSLVFDDSVSWGNYFSTECAEDIAFVTPSDVTAAAQAYPSAIRDDQLISLQGELPACQEWHVAPVSPTEAQPVSSAIPTLVLEGEYDPITPPANGALAAQTLSHSYQFLFPGTGHGAFLFNPSACPVRVVVAFQADPSHKPDGSCIAGMGEPAFQ